MSERATSPATLPGSRRLKTQHHFRAVYQRGRRAAGPWLTVVALLRRGPNGEPQENVRLGVSVSKDHGGAVRRNKLKRLLREAFRLERHRLPLGLDLVLIPRQREDDFPLAVLRSEIVALVERSLHASGNERRPRRPS